MPKTYTIKTIIILLLFPCLVNATLSKGLVAFYPFNGNANDASGNHHHGKVNQAIPTKDRFGNDSNAYQFNDNTNIVVNSFKHFKWGEQLTLSFWFVISPEKSHYQSIIHTGHHSKGSWEVRMKSDAQGIRISAGVNTQKKQSYFWRYSHRLSNHNTDWHHFVMSYDGKQLFLYFDGEKKITTAINFGDILSTENALMMGQESVTNPKEQFYGLIDDVYIFNRALQKNEMLNLYNNNYSICTDLLNAVQLNVKYHSYNSGFDDGINQGIQSCKRNPSSYGISILSEEQLDEKYDGGYLDGYMVGRYDGYQESKKFNFGEGYIVGKYDGYNKGVKEGYDKNIRKSATHNELVSRLQKKLSQIENRLNKLTSSEADKMKTHEIQKEIKNILMLFSTM